MMSPLSLRPALWLLPTALILLATGVLLLIDAPVVAALLLCSGTASLVIGILITWFSQGHWFKKLVVVVLMLLSAFGGSSCIFQFKMRHFLEHYHEHWTAIHQIVEKKNGQLTLFQGGVVDAIGQLDQQERAGLLEHSKCMPFQLVQVLNGGIVYSFDACIGIQIQCYCVFQSNAIPPEWIAIYDHWYVRWKIKN